MQKHISLCLLLTLLLMSCVPSAQAPVQPNQAEQPQVIQGEWQEAPLEQPPKSVNASGMVQDYTCTKQQLDKFNTYETVGVKT